MHIERRAREKYQDFFSKDLLFPCQMVFLYMPEGLQQAVDQVGDHLLPDRNVIVIANHCSNLDPVIMGAVFRVRYGKIGAFGAVPFWSMVRWLSVPCPWINRDSQSAGGGFKAFLKLLKRGENVLLFPQKAEPLRTAN